MAKIKQPKLSNQPKLQIKQIGDYKPLPKFKSVICKNC